MFPIPNIPDNLSREIYAELCRNLPIPTPDTPETRAARDERAMMAVAHYLPENASEAELAVQIVLADFHAKDALRGAAEAGARGDPDGTRRCRAQAASMMRTMQGGVRTLLKVQAVREKAEDARRPYAMERSGYWFKDMSVPAPTPPPEPVRATAQQSEQRTFEQMDEAEQYAVLYPDRAALIRAHGGLPARVTFGPPEPGLVQAIVRSESPLLLALDGQQDAVSGGETADTKITPRDAGEMGPEWASLVRRWHAAGRANAT